MMMTQSFKNILILLVTAAVACFSANAKKKETPRAYFTFPTHMERASQRFGNLDYGIRLQLRNDISARDIINLSELPSKEAENFPAVTFENSFQAAVEEYLDNSLTSLGFNVGADFDTDYVLEVSVKDYQLRVTDYNTKKKSYRSSGAMVITWSLRNADGEVVITNTTSTGRATADTAESLLRPLSTAYTQALGGIDWDRIASKLKISKTARQEKNKAVTGKGDTALESTVIRWYIISSPQGADVSWRVVSSTPDVSNTMSNFVGTTPYETTESFDIKGLTYNNSGNVQIEIECTRNGYLPQKKRFNLRQVIDQKEISAKFNLVKEDTEE